MMALTLLRCLTAAALAAPACRPSAGAEDKIAAAASRALIHVGPGYGGGSGFFFDDRGFILTNAHNVQLFAPNPKTGKIALGKFNAWEIPAKGRWPAVRYLTACFGPSCPRAEPNEGRKALDDPNLLLAEIVRYDHGRDLAVLRVVDAKRASWPALSLAREPLEAGQPLVVVDGSVDHWARPSFGLVVSPSAPKSAFDGHDLLAPGFRGATTDAMTRPGFSGSPVVDYCSAAAGDPKAVGVLFGGDGTDGSKTLSYFIPAAEARAFLDERETVAAMKTTQARVDAAYAKALRERERALRQSALDAMPPRP